MSVKTLLVEEFKSEIEEIGKLEVGSEQHKAAVDSATKLVDRIIEIEKFESDRNAKENNQKTDTDLKLRQLEDEKKDRFIRNCITVGIAAGQLTAAGLAFVMSMNFEKEGTLTTEGGRSSLKQLLKFRS